MSLSVVIILSVLAVPMLVVIALAVWVYVTSRPDSVDTELDSRWLQ